MIHTLGKKQATEAAVEINQILDLLDKDFKVVEEQKKNSDMWKTKSKMTDVNPAISIVTLFLKGLNKPIKRQRLSEWIFFFFVKI